MECSMKVVYIICSHSSVLPRCQGALETQQESYQNMRYDRLEEEYRSAEAKWQQEERDLLSANHALIEVSGPASMAKWNLCY
jgi:hypothetical protein